MDVSSLASKLAKGWWFILVIVLFVAAGFLYHQKTKVFLYAWERPEDLSFLDPATTGVVYYAASITVKDGQVLIKPRLQPLILNPETVAIPLIRIDNFDTADKLTDTMILEFSRYILAVCTERKPGCQIDFDAHTQERDFYKRLLEKVRADLPSNVPLSITTLVSWCDSSSWINDLPISQAVPMFYQMGPDANLIQKGLTGKSFMKSSKCQSSIAISLDESLPNYRYRQNKDIYIFNSRSWTQSDFSRIMSAL